MSIRTAARPNRKLESPHDRRITWLLVPLGAATGLTLGATARAWMRWISTDPEFSWTGTIAIVVSFTVFGAAQSAAAVARIRAIHPVGIAVIRGLAVVLSAGLFGAAGAVMLPTVLFGSLALWRSDAPNSVRVTFATIAVPGVIFVVAGIVEDNGWGAATIGQIVLFLCIYAVIIAATWPTAAPSPDAWRPSRRLVLICGCVLVAVVGLALYFGGIQ